MEEIRRGTAADIDGVWEVLEPIIKAGDTLVHAPDSTKEKIIDLYFADDKFLYVAEHEDKVVGVFYIKANQPDLGSHVEMRVIWFIKIIEVMVWQKKCVGFLWLKPKI